MKLMIKFDADANIGEVASSVIDNRGLLHSKFLERLYNKPSKHPYRQVI